MSLQLARERAARVVAVRLLLLGLAGSVLLAVPSAGWVQGAVRLGCWRTARDWHCADPLSVVLVLATIAACGLAIAGAVLIVRATCDGALDRRRMPAAAAAAAVLPTLAIAAVLLWDASMHDGVSVPTAADRTALWTRHVLPAALSTVVSGMLAAAGLHLRAARAPRAAAALVLAGLALLLVAAALTGLGTAAAGLTAGAVIAAAWRVAAAPEGSAGAAVASPRAGALAAPRARPPGGE